MRHGVRLVGLVLAFTAACKFPALPDLPEDGPSADSDPDGTSPVDARVRTGPLVTNGQAADLVLGQPSFGTNTDRGVTAQGFQPEGLAFDAGRLWVSDYFRHRVLGWDTPTASDAPANYVLGQSNFTSGTSTTPAATTLFQPEGVIAVGGRVIVLDGYNRVLIWTTLPSTPGLAADLVLGQTGFTTSGGGNGPTQQRTPNDGWSDGTRLLVRGGFTLPRVWSWSTFPTANATPSDVQVLGGANPSATEFGPLGGVTSDGTKLVMSDPGHNRVLIWNTIPTTSGQSADVVLGQATFTAEAAGANASGMNTPRGVLIVDGALFVADTGNDRVLVFDPLPAASGASASQVLGQTTTATSVLDQTASDHSLNAPTGLTIAGRKLFVGDVNNRRVLRYDLSLP